jgi:hypothetical protein
MATKVAEGCEVAAIASRATTTDRVGFSKLRMLNPDIFLAVPCRSASG